MNMHSLGRSALAAAAMLALPASAGAVIIDFDDMVAPDMFSQARPLGAQYADQGVAFGRNGAVLNEIADFGVTGFSLPNSVGYAFNTQLRGSSRPTSLMDIIRFSAPQLNVSFDVGAGYTPLDFMASAFDDSGDLISSTMIALGATAQTLSFSGDISRIEFVATGGNELSAFAIDNLVFDGAPAFIETPAPAAMLLLGLGAAALVGRRRTVVA